MNFPSYFNFNFDKENFKKGYFGWWLLIIIYRLDFCSEQNMPGFSLTKKKD